MKKILFVTNQLITGGMEIALHETIKILKSKNFDITVATMHSGGELLADFQKICNVKDLSAQYKQAFITMSTITENAKHLQLISLLKNCIILFKNHFLSYYKMKERISSRMPNDMKEYDVAVAYATPYTSFVPYIINKVTAKRKIGWIELDVSNYLKNIDMSEFEECYNKLDYVVCDSEASRKSFTTRHPSLINKTKVIYNPIDVEKIKHQSNEVPSTLPEENIIKICSIGRLSDAKGFDMAISACNILTNKGYPLVWLICGDGGEKENLMNAIKEKKLENEFVLLGNQKNPYKYIAATDIYVQPSRTESYCITLAEARVLKKPIVTTNFPCAHEHITDGHNGFICEMTPEAIADAIEKLINSPELRETFSKNTKPVDEDYTKLKELFE